MPKYQLLPIPLKQGFANSGIKQRVPYQLPAADDDLSWLEGFTDAYQRPVIAENLGEKSGRYVRMGQINQILENVSQAFLNVKQSLDNVSETIDKGIKVDIDKIITEADAALTNRKVVWLQTLGNQNCAGIKNFTQINVNNFKNTPNAVANIELAQGLPYWGVQKTGTLNLDSSLTITNKNVQFLFCPLAPVFYNGGACSCSKIIVNGKSDSTSYVHNNPDAYCVITEVNISMFFLRKGDVLSYVNKLGGYASAFCTHYNIIGS